MSKVEKFEDLIAWQKARELTSNIYKITRQGSFAKDFGLSNQLQRAAVSIMSNIAEGFERGNRAEFHHFLTIAKGSCAEVRCQLYIAFDARHINQESFESFLSQTQEIGRIVGGLRASVEKQRDEQRRLK